MNEVSQGRLRPHHTKLSAIHKLLDATVIGVTYYLIVPQGAGWSDRDTISVIAAIVLFYEFAQHNGLYSSWRIASLTQEAVSICTLWAYTVFLLIVTAGALGALQETPARPLWLWALLVPVLVIAWHFALRLLLRQMRRAGFNTRRVGIVGQTGLGVQLARHLHQNPWLGLTASGFYDDRTPLGERVADAEGTPLLGNLDELLDKARAGEVDVVFIALPFQAEKRIAQLITQLRATTAAVYFAQDFKEFEILHGRSYMLGDIPLVSVHENPFAGVGGVAKRIEDLVLGVVICALIALPALLIAVAVKLSSKGPALFVQRRYGLDGREIRVLKFRTMYVTEDSGNVQQATVNDPRVTPLGRVLRRTSMDELPQFVNVLQGNMSIVGPRPHAVAHNESYRGIVDSYMLRHKVKPGITGWAQVNGWRGELTQIEDMQKRVEFDLEYIRNWSIWLDVRIIAATIMGGFTGKKAY